MRALRRMTLIINVKAIVVALAAVASTMLCERYGLEADLPLTLVATAVVFPLVFSISGAYKRRETALAHYGSIKAHGRMLFFAVRDWLKDPSEEVVDQARGLLGDLLQSCRELLSGPRGSLPENEERVYAEFSRLSRFIRDDLRGRGLSGGEVSRCNQFLSKMLLAFESTKHLYQYRTPRALRAFSDFFIVALPIAYGPHFARAAANSSFGLHYVIPVLLTVILVSLDKIQDHLENPFDQIGEDDVTIHVEKFVAGLKG